MPAGLLLSPTARTVRSGPFEESPVGAVPFSVMRRPSSGLQLRRFPPYRPQSRLPPAPSPARWLGQRHGHRPPHPLQGPAMASLPCLGRHAYFLPCPLSREYRSRRLPAPPVASDPPPVFPCRTSFAAVRPSRSFQARRVCAQPAFSQPSRHLCAKKNDFVKKKTRTLAYPPLLCLINQPVRRPKAPRKQGQKIEKIKK